MKEKGKKTDKKKQRGASYIGRMESVNVAGVLQEAGDADSRARTRTQV